MTVIASEQKARIGNSFGAQDMMASLGASIDDISHGAVTIRAPNLADFSQQQGFAHAAVAFALGDSAAGYAALTTMGLDQEVVTSEMKIHLLAPARGKEFLAKGRVIRAGRRQVIAAASVWMQTGEGPDVHVAELMGTMVPVNNR